MKRTETPLPGVLLLEPRVFRDARGHFLETWNRKAFEEAGIRADFVQDNASRSLRRVLRGLHYQVRKSQGKLVTCLRGEIFDVAVDLRRGSPAFGRGFGCRLAGDRPSALWIPPGFAHGFLVLSEEADVHYKVTEFYSPADERGIAWNDPALGIEWPLDGGAPILNERDAAFPPLSRAELP